MSSGNVLGGQKSVQAPFWLSWTLLSCRSIGVLVGLSLKEIKWSFPYLSLGSIISRC